MYLGKFLCSHRLNLLQLFVVIGLYIFNLYFGVNQSIDLNLIATTVVLFSLTLSLYYIRNTYTINPNYLEHFIFIILLCIFSYNIYNGNYYVFISAFLYFVIQLIKHNFVTNDKVTEFLTNVKKDDDTLEKHFKESFLIFNILRSFRPVCSFVIIVFGLLSVYTYHTYDGFIIISLSSARFFVSYYLMVSVLLLFISLYSINFMNTPTVMPFFKSCATCTKYVFIGGGFFFGMSTTCVPIFTPPECYNDALLDKFQKGLGIPQYRSEEETNAYRQVQFYKIWNNKFKNQDSMLPNGRVNPIKMNALMQKVPSEMYWGRKK